MWLQVGTAFSVKEEEVCFSSPAGGRQANNKNVQALLLRYTAVQPYSVTLGADMQNLGQSLSPFCMGDGTR
jgi:hypothetical protein